MSLCQVALVQICVADHHKWEGLELQDNAGVCATAPEWRLALSDRSRLTTIAAHIVNVKGERTAWSCLWDAPAEVGPSVLHKFVFNVMEKKGSVVEKLSCGA